MVREGLLTGVVLSIDKTARALGIRARGPIACHVIGQVVLVDDVAVHLILRNGGGNPATVDAKAEDGTLLATWSLEPHEGLVVPLATCGFLKGAVLWEATAYVRPRPPRKGLCRFEHVREGDDDPWGDW